MRRSFLIRLVIVSAMGLAVIGLLVHLLLAKHKPTDDDANDSSIGQAAEEEPTPEPKVHRPRAAPAVVRLAPKPLGQDASVQLPGANRSAPQPQPAQTSDKSIDRLLAELTSTQMRVAQLQARTQMLGQTAEADEARAMLEQLRKRVASLREELGLAPPNTDDTKSRPSSQ